MANSGLHGAHPLTKDGIKTNVTSTAPGAYALGKVEYNTFLISRIGRSDDDLPGRLSDYIGQYNQFKFGYLGSAKEAFEYECRLFHDFSPPDNIIHPDRPDGSTLKCPHCRNFDQQDD